MAKHTIQLVVNDPDALRAALFPVFAHGTRRGVDFMTRSTCPFPRGKGRNPAPKLSYSAVVYYAIACGIRACAAAEATGVTALPERAGSADADRLRAAMGTMTPIEVCRAAGLKDSASVRNVTRKGAPLAGKMLLWVEAREAEVGT